MDNVNGVVGHIENEVPKGDLSNSWSKKLKIKKIQLVGILNPLRLV